DFFQLNERVDVLFAADVLYDSANRSFLPAFLDAANEVWLTDSRVKSLTAPHYQRLYSVMSETLPDLNEFDEFRLVNFYYGRREQS
ncbi:MAG: methyltransferase, partial [Moraxellaceae bacterium]|nr:methyltransferase [Moraxellaceae bacterium]